MSALYTTVDKHEPCQLVATHPLRWHDREDPAVFLVEAKYTTTEVIALVKAALELVHHDADTPRLHRAIDLLEVAAAIMEERDPSPWQDLLAEDDY